MKLQDYEKLWERKVREKVELARRARKITRQEVRGPRATVGTTARLGVGSEMVG